MIYPDDFWWKNVTGPQTFIRHTVNALCSGSSPVLQLPVELPWRYAMRTAFLEKIQETSSGFVPYFEAIDAADDCADRDIGDFLLERFASQKVASGYRSRSGLTVQQYLEKNDVLKGKLLWIKGIPATDICRWQAFCRGFKAPSLKNGCFVLEYRGELPSSFKDQAQALRLEDFVSRYDIQLFSSFLLASQENALPKPWQNYVATVLSHLCGIDAELCECLLRHENWRTEDPRELFQKEADARKTLRARAYAQSTDGIHGEELTRRLWAAQIEILFPRIETMRIRIIENLYDELASALKIMPLKQFEQTVTCPEELEIGTIIFLMNQKLGAGYERLVHVPDENMRSTIHTLRECRNLLAHRHQCCSPEQTDFILSLDV